MKIGRYNSLRQSRWGDPDRRRLSPFAKLAELYLETGPNANMAGIGPLDPEAMVRETGMARHEVDSALGELEKSRLVVISDGIVWVCRKLNEDPAREGDPKISNEKHRIGIETILGSLPKGNAAVRKFRNYYRFKPDTPSKGSRRGTDTVSKGNTIPVAASASASENKNTTASVAASDLEASPTARPPSRGAPSTPENNGSTHTPSREEIEAERRRATEELRTKGCTRIVAEQLERMTWPSRLTYFEHHGIWPTEPITTPTDEAQS